MILVYVSAGSWPSDCPAVLVSIAKAKPLIRDLITLGEKSVLMLDRSVEDPVDLYVGDRLIARGILEEQDGENAGQLQVRLTEVADLQSGV